MTKKAKATQERSRYNLRPQKPKAIEAESNDEIETDVATSSTAPSTVAAPATSAAAAPTALKKTKKGRGGVKKRKKATVNPRAHGQFTNFSSPMTFTNAGGPQPPSMSYSNSVYGPTHSRGQMTSGVAHTSGFSPYPPQMTMGAPRVNAPPNGRMVGSSPHLQRMMTGGPQAVNHHQHNQMMSRGPQAVNHPQHNQLMSGGPQAVNHQQYNQPPMGAQASTWNNILNTADGLRRTIENIMVKTELEVNNACHQHGFGHLVQQPLLLGNQRSGPVRLRPASSFPGNMNQMSRNNMAGRQHVSMMGGQMAGRPGQQVGRSGPQQRVVHGELGAQQQMRHLQQQAQKQGGRQKVVQTDNQVSEAGDQVGNQKQGGQKRSEQQVGNQKQGGQKRSEQQVGNQKQGGQKRSEQQVGNQVQQEEQAAMMAQGEEDQQRSSVEAPAEQGENKSEGDGAFKVPIPPASK